jgi:hypothetical protein
VKVTIDQRAHPGIDDAVERAMVRYWAAQAEYEGVVVRNIELTLNGGKPSQLARLDEERAFEALDCARHALFTAAAVAFPTIH